MNPKDFIYLLIIGSHIFIHQLLKFRFFELQGFLDIQLCMIWQHLVAINQTAIPEYLSSTSILDMIIIVKEH